MKNKNLNVDTKKINTMINKNMIPMPIGVINMLNSVVSNVLDVKNCDKSEQNIQKMFKLLASLYFRIYDLCNEDRNAQDFNTTYVRELHYTNIHIDQLKPFKISINKIAFEYSDLIESLIRCGLIMRNDEYSNNKNFTKTGKTFSKSYCYNSKFISTKIQWIEIDFNKVFNCNILTQKEYIKKYPKYKKLINNTYDTYIDLNGLSYKLNYMLDSTIKRKTTFKGGLKIQKDVKMTIEKKYSILVSAIKYNLGLHWFKPTTTGRFYSSASNLNKICLPFLNHKSGKDLIQIDAKNSQPLLLSTLIDNPQYKLLVESGLFYEKIQNVLSLNSREDAKLYCYSKIFFNDNKITGNDLEVLNNNFNGLGDQINIFKIGKEGQDENKLWFKLQSLESTIWMNTTLNFNSFAITRHDSVIIFKEDFNDFNNLITESYNNQNIEASFETTSYFLGEEFKKSYSKSKSVETEIETIKSLENTQITYKHIVIEKVQTLKRNSIKKENKLQFKTIPLFKLYKGKFIATK